MSNAFTLNNISFCYPSTAASIISIPKLCIEHKSRVFIRGSSGSGKTTLLGLLSGVLTPTSGSISILDIENFNKLSGSRRDAIRARHIGFIFQMFNILPYLSVIENVLLGLQFSPERTAVAAERGSPEQEAKRLLARLGIDSNELISRKVVELSVGQQQRVSAARALIGSPEIVIADEPTSALDAENRDRFLELLINECKEAESTLVFVSHDSSLSSHFDRVITMDEFSGCQSSTLISSPSPEGS
jgi:putative ABC transport system ATP-binding protein